MIILLQEPMESGSMTLFQGIMKLMPRLKLW